MPGNYDISGLMGKQVTYKHAGCEGAGRVVAATYKYEAVFVIIASDGTGSLNTVPLEHVTSVALDPK